MVLIAARSKPLPWDYIDSFYTTILATTGCRGIGVGGRRSLVKSDPVSPQLWSVWLSDGGRFGCLLPKPTIEERASESGETATRNSTSRNGASPIVKAAPHRIVGHHSTLVGELCIWRRALYRYIALDHRSSISSHLIHIVGSRGSPPTELCIDSHSRPIVQIGADGTIYLRVVHRES